MQRFKTVAKKMAICLKKYSIYLLSVLKAFCKKVIPFVTLAFTACFKKSPRIAAAILAIIISLSCFASVAVATGATSAYAVVYNGETIAMVKEPSVLAEAEIFAVNKVNNPNCTSHLIKTNLNKTLVSENVLVCSDELADSIINYSNDIALVTVLTVDGTVVATDINEEKINSTLNEYLLNYKRENGVENVEFSNEYKIKNIYLLKSEVEKLSTVEAYLESTNNAFSVESVNTVTVTEDIPFETIKTESTSLSVGTQKITEQGVVGKKEVVYKVYSLDGVETKRTAISSAVIVEPVAQKVTVGTKRVVAADKNGNAVMMWPVKRVERSYVSSYVGDGRGHKGMDIVAPAGTPIYAAAGGTVTYSGWDTSGYGYKIVIKHSDTYETLYAHCSALYVKKGDKVAKGETVGAVGTTGRSTGNHLHFEVHKNGTFTDPALYIGRN